MSFKRYPLADDLTEEDTGTERMLKEEKVLLRPSVRRALRAASTTTSVYEEKPKLWTDTHQGHMVHCARLTASSVLDGTSPFWARLPDLQKLEVEDGKDLMKQLSKRFAAMAKLEYLSIAWTEMRAPPTGCLKPTLKTLILRQDEIRSLAGIDGLGALEELDLSVNRLSVLPKSVGNLRCLRTLVVSGNRLKALPESIGRLVNLETLNVSSNRLTRLPDALTGLERLRDLDVSGNHLDQLPDDFGRLARLVDFRASGNQLTCLPESFAHLKSLVSLLVGNNRLLFVPMVLGALGRLEILNLRENHISTVECALSSVRSLVLDANRLPSICSGICLCENLEVLSVERNSIASIPPEIGDLKRLRSLQLSGNPLTDVPPELIRTLEERGVAVRLNQTRQRRRAVEEEEEAGARRDEEEGEAGDRMTHFPEQSISVEAVVSGSSDETLNDANQGQSMNGDSGPILPGGVEESDREKQSDPTSDCGQNATTTSSRDNPENSIPSSSEMLATKL